MYENIAIFTKEIRSFFCSLIGYMVIGIFGLILGLIMWVFPDFSILITVMPASISCFPCLP